MTASPADLESRVCAALDRQAKDLPALGVAVSGGGDSTALMHMIANWAAGRRIQVATVDHGLRAESASEAQKVARNAAKLGLRHDVLLWQRETSEGGNLMANAREGRMRLLSDWAKRHDLPAIAFGHTADDQAETLLMRLARGAGIDGLSGMAETRQFHDIRWLRPMLQTTREELRRWLTDHGLDWIDDPSNENTDYDRVRIRHAMTALALDPQAIALSATNLGKARAALNHYTARLAEQAIIGHGSLHLPHAPLQDAPPEIFRRLLIAGCRWITGANYPPRRQTVLNALESIAAHNRVTLDGVLIEPMKDMLRLIREPAAAKKAGESHGPDWDNRWNIKGLQKGEHIAALGFAPLIDLPWRDSSLSRDEAASSPAVWNGTKLIAAPLLRDCDRYIAEPLRNATDLRRLLLVH
ncbi:tRNA lysidine(34) synthetase TilS [Paracoccus onubensis]|uniref:tRNA lysidine(34) synthetase TilS n=1 Tax=Paracoccus onubensis TaxID=1675788 RepID=UPI00272FD821|nr:tRNA lysidine(34) synthetase TilS [Paracoccus onubensis]MDP0929796.1 tRNA lysidine(34) synthetase TilS [Paracoccus onubensis]